MQQKEIMVDFRGEIMQEKNMGTNAIFSIMKTVLSIVFPLITFPYATRTLGVAAIGAYNYSLSIVSYFILIAGLGIATYGIREGARIRNDQRKLRGFCSQIFTINICATLFSYLILFGVLFFSTKLSDYKETILILSLEVVFTTLGMNWLYSIFEEFKIMTIVTFIVQAIAVVLMLIFVKSPDDYYRYIWISVFTSIAPNIILLFFSKKLCIVKITRNVQWKKHIKPIFLLFSMSIATTIYVSLDTTMLGIMTDDYHVGYYSVSVKIYKIVKQLLNAIVLVVIPRASMLAEEKERFEELLKKIGNTIVTLIIPVITGMIFMSKEIIYLISGKEYVAAAPSLKILSGALFFAVLGNLYANCILVPLKRENLVLKITTISAVINMLLNIVLIRLYQENAAAFTTLVSEAVVFIYCRYISKNNVKISVNIDNKTIFCGIATFCGITIICVLGKVLINNYVVRLLICIIASMLWFVSMSIIFHNNVIYAIKKMKHA